MTDLAEPFVAGLVAGYGVAIPVGAIGVLVVDAGMRGGFRPAAAAASGVATADFLYAALAAAAGAIIAGLLAPWQRTVQLVAAAVLVAVAAIRLRSLSKRRATEAGEDRHAPSGRHLYCALPRAHVGQPRDRRVLRRADRRLPAVSSAPAEAKVVFVLAAGAASLSWQLVLGAAGATLHHKLPPGARLWTGIAGNALVLALAARMALTALDLHGRCRPSAPARPSPGVGEEARSRAPPELGSGVRLHDRAIADLRGAGPRGARARSARPTLHRLRPQRRPPLRSARFTTPRSTAARSPAS